MTCSRSARFSERSREVSASRFRMRNDCVELALPYSVNRLSRDIGKCQTLRFRDSVGQIFVLLAKESVQSQIYKTSMRAEDFQGDPQASIDSAGAGGSFSLAIYSFQLCVLLHSCPKHKNSGL